MTLSSSPLFRYSSVTSQWDFEACKTRSRLKREKSTPDDGGIKRQIAWKRKVLTIYRVRHKFCDYCTSKQAGSKYFKDNENLFHSILFKRKSKILYGNFWSFVLFSAQYYKNEKNEIFAVNMHLFMIGKFSQNWKFYLCVIPWFQGYIFFLL